MEYFLILFKFPQIKEWGPDFWGEPILQEVWIIWSPLLSFMFKSFKDPNSSSFIRFKCILYHSGEVFSEFWNFYKLKRGEPILQNSWIIWSPSCISILKISRTQIFCHWSDFNAFCMIQKYFSRNFQMPKNQRRGT